MSDAAPSAAVSLSTEIRISGVSTVPSAERTGADLALYLGTTTGWVVRTAEGLITNGTACFRSGRFDGGGMRYLRFTSWVGGHWLRGVLPEVTG